MGENFITDDLKCKVENNELRCGFVNEQRGTANLRPVGLEEARFKATKGRVLDCTLYDEFVKGELEESLECEVK